MTGMGLKVGMSITALMDISPSAQLKFTPVVAFTEAWAMVTLLWAMWTAAWTLMSLRSMLGSSFVFAEDLAVMLSSRCPENVMVALTGTSMPATLSLASKLM